MSGLKGAFQELRHYPSAIAGIMLIVALVALAIYTVIAIPYEEAITRWRGGENIWIENPRHARPQWLNLLPGINLPETIVISSQDEEVSQQTEALGQGMIEVTTVFHFAYLYDGFPQEVTVFLSPQYQEKRPHVTLTWLPPSGEEVRLTDLTLRGPETYRVSQDNRLQRRLRGRPLPQALFADPEAETLVPLKGTYELRVAALVFEGEAKVDAKFVLYGQVYGLAGTDHRRRDLMLALLWGTPVALAFGFLAAIGSTMSTMIIAAIGSWFGGWVDAAIQRITEVNLILPALPILIMVGAFYSRSIWLMLGVVILLGIFSAGIKSYRAIFLQVKESPYVEAARAYGAGNFRIVFLYLIPRIVPVLVPQFVVLIPSFVFLEATLAVLGLGDPVLPTWGKVLNDANSNGALYQGHYYWVLEPAALLMLTGLGFAMVGFALDRIFNPRLRDL
ncbi:MAG TPA: ABC transporter permease [Caldilineaceae bacterium]|nr:ABC transporter permease [Caldilineaceae bacterium]